MSDVIHGLIELYREKRQIGGRANEQVVDCGKWL